MFLQPDSALPLRNLKSRLLKTKSVGENHLLRGYSTHFYNVCFDYSQHHHEKKLKKPTCRY